jgi:DNA-binding XRE family transcriptional regulator
MEKSEFSDIRRHLGKTQIQMARLLGVSLKAIQSFEQGYRKVPMHVERQLLFLLAHSGSPYKNNTPCWKIKNCPLTKRQNCPAWEYKLGHICWFINGTICDGEAKENWQEKMELCRNCEIFLSMLPEELRSPLS